MKDKIKQIVDSLTLKEKASLCSGYDFWNTVEIKDKGIPSALMTDGPHGLRNENEEETGVAMKISFPATCFPTAVTQASSWNKDLMYKVGSAMAEECKDQQVCTILGPGTNIKRSPICGRNFEYFSEDPFLAGELSASYIDGVQSKGIGTSLKHFAMNNQEYLRMTISSTADERTIRELYFPPFERAIQSQPQQVMCSYNKINGIYSSDNKWLLTDVLRKEWGFKGIVVSDWGAVNDRIQGVRAGMDLQMPVNPGDNERIIKSVKKGDLSMEELDTVVYRLVKYAIEAASSKDFDYKYDYTKGHQISKEMAVEGAVLLKNDENILPLNQKEKVLVIGAMAETPRYQGAGSSGINPMNVVSFNETLTANNVKFDYNEGYTLEGDGKNVNLLNEAVANAKTADKVILVAGLPANYETEGYDRDTIDMPKSHNELIKAVAEVNKNVIVVLQGGSPVTMPWLGQVKSVLNMYLTGEANGEAMFDLIYGITSPSGKLAETFPNSLEDFMPQQYYKGGPTTVDHKESIYVGYRYYEKAKKDVLFPFGFGMSYTQFEYSDLKLSSDKIKDTDTLEISLKVKNTGKVEGKEIIQLYVNDEKSTIFKPEKELKEFAKVSLKPGEEKEVKFTLSKRAFAYWNTNASDWVVESGDFNIIIGASSQDIKLTEKVYVKSTNEVASPITEKDCPEYYNLSGLNEISDDAFKSILGHEIPENRIPKKGEFNRNSTLTDIKNTWIGKLFLNFGMKIIKSQAKDVDFNTMLMIEVGYKEVPIRNFASFSQGIVTKSLLNAIIRWANGYFFGGLFTFIGSLPKVVATLIKLRINERKKRKYREKLKKQKQKNK